MRALELELQGLRQPRPPKPHVMQARGWWYLVDPPFGTWLQRKPITKDPRPELAPDLLRERRP